MWHRASVAAIVAIALVAGYPYAALILNRLIGTNAVVFTERDGLQRTLIMGPNAPLPDWLPLLPRSLVVQAGRWLPSPDREVAGDVELLTHKGVEAVKRFYRDGLGSVGFAVRDIGYGSLDAPSAAYLGIANILEGYHSDLHLTITVTTRASAGLIISSRIVQIHWQ